MITIFVARMTKIEDWVCNCSNGCKQQQQSPPHAPTFLPKLRTLFIKLGRTLYLAILILGLLPRPRSYNWFHCASSMKHLMDLSTLPLKTGWKPIGIQWVLIGIFLVAFRLGILHGVAELIIRIRFGLAWCFLNLATSCFCAFTTYCSCVEILPRRWTIAFGQLL